MKQTCKRGLSLLLSLTLAFGAFLIGMGNLYVSAICCRKDYFDKSRYTLTGDMPHDVAVIAKSQKGRTRSDFGYTEGWCDEFVADCLENAGADSSIVAHGGTVADFERVMRSKGAVTVTSPKEGDLIFFSNLDHVEIVTKVVSGQVYCAGGNNGDYPGKCNGERSISGWGTARVYLRPNYPTQPAYYNPQGTIDALEGGEGGVYVRGWAFDYDMPSTSVEIHVYIGGPAGTGEGHNGILANVYREDVNNVYSLSGNHGYETFINTSLRGSQPVYVYAINVGGGDNVQIGSGTVTISDPPPTYYNPTGAVDFIEGRTGSVWVRGWVFDYDMTSIPTEVHIYIGGEAGYGEGHVYTANTYRPDVDTSYGVGEYHGYDFIINTELTGTQPVYVYGINLGEGNNVLLGYDTVTIAEGHNPTGDLNAIVGKTGKVYVCGWAFDYDAPDSPVEVDVYVGGNYGAGGEGHPLWANTYRPDVNTNYGVGDYHGFETSFITQKTGTQPVYVYALNIGNGSHSLIWRGEITIIADTTAPVISNARITSITTSGYTVSCDIQDDTQIAEIKFPTWTANTGDNSIDQDDIEWPEVSFDGKTATYNVQICNHNYETGRYKTHIYAFDVFGNRSAYLFENIYVPSESEKYTIVYNSNGGNDAPESHSDYISVKLSDNIPTRSNYSFVGWATSADAICAEYYPGETIKPESDLTLYAVWQPNAYTVTLDPDGGVCGIPAITAYYNEIYGTLPEPTRDGFAFDGWFLADGTLVTESTICTMTADHTLTAHWTAVETSGALTAKADSGAMVDRERGFVYGLAFGVTEAALREQYLDIADGTHIEIERVTAAIGTGTVLHLVDDTTGDELESFTVVIFGDVTGDGLLNSSDVTEIRSVNAGIITYEADSAQFFAADVTRDGNVNSSDVTEFRNANAGISDVSQTI